MRSWLVGAIMLGKQGSSVADFVARIIVQHDELGQAIINICQVVPKGVVVFCPSYDFLWQVQARWDKTGAITRLGQRKKASRRYVCDLEES